jgi:hypothetical protein
MSNEEMEKKMEFIVEQQAKFAAEIEIQREVQATQGKRLSDALIAVVGIVGKLAEAQVRMQESVNRLTEAQAGTEDRVIRLTEAQTRTEERLNILISVVERYFGGNGPAESPA